MPNNINEILTQNLWYNAYITVNKECIFWKSWFDKDVKLVSELLDSEYSFLSLNELKIKFDVTCKFIEHIRFRQAIMGMWRKVISQKINNIQILDSNDIKPFYIGTLQKSVHFVEFKCKDLYWILVNKLNVGKTPTCIARWERIYEIDTNMRPDSSSAFMSCT